MINNQKMLVMLFIIKCWYYVTLDSFCYTAHAKLKQTLCVKNMCLWDRCLSWHRYSKSTHWSSRAVQYPSWSGESFSHPCQCTHGSQGAAECRVWPVRELHATTQCSLLCSQETEHVTVGWSGIIHWCTNLILSREWLVELWVYKK